MPNCLQRPVRINKILELQDRNKANVHASEEDKNELRTYIAHEQNKVNHLTEVVGNHEAHIDKLDAQLIDARTELHNVKERYEAVAPDVKHLRSALILADNEMMDYKGRMDESIERSEVKFCDYGNTAVKALREQREESHKAYNAS
eukprot:2320334-Heterocapsa_arctica.AAC.1